MAAGHFCHEVGGRGRDDDEIAVAREADVADIEFALRIEQVGEGVLAAQRADGERRDEFLRGLGQNAAHARAAVPQAANEIERFVGRDAAGDDEEDARGRVFAGSRAHGAFAFAWVLLRR